MAWLVLGKKAAKKRAVISFQVPGLHFPDWKLIFKTNFSYIYKFSYFNKDQTFYLHLGFSLSTGVAKLLTCIKIELQLTCWLEVSPINPALWAPICSLRGWKALAAIENALHRLDCQLKPHLFASVLVLFYFFYFSSLFNLMRDPTS